MTTPKPKCIKTAKTEVQVSVCLISHNTQADAYKPPAPDKPLKNVLTVLYQICLIKQISFKKQTVAWISLFSVHDNTRRLYC